jgi:hypothetical protein
MDISPERLAAADRRLAGIERQVDRLVWNWRLHSHQCPGGACRKQDRTEDSITFCQRLVEDLGWPAEACELVTVLVRRLKDVTPVVAPEHQWIATDGTSAHCSCGTVIEAPDRAAAEQGWTEHAGDGALVMPWYAS